MADPVLFLPPVIVPRDQYDHRMKVSGLGDQAFAQYYDTVDYIYRTGRLTDLWKWDHVKEELEDRRVRVQPIRD